MEANPWAIDIDMVIDGMVIRGDNGIFSDEEN